MYFPTNQEIFPTLHAKNEIVKGLKHVQFMVLSPDSIVVTSVCETKQFAFVREKRLNAKHHIRSNFCSLKSLLENSIIKAITGQAIRPVQIYFALSMFSTSLKHASSFSYRIV